MAMGFRIGLAFEAIHKLETPDPFSKMMKEMMLYETTTKMLESWGEKGMLLEVR